MSNACCRPSVICWFKLSVLSNACCSPSFICWCKLLVLSDACCRPSLICWLKLSVMSDACCRPECRASGAPCCTLEVCDAPRVRNGAGDAAESETLYVTVRVATVLYCAVPVCVSVKWEERSRIRCCLYRVIYSKKITQRR